MSRVGETNTSGRGIDRARSLLVWVGRGVVLLLIAFSLFLAATRLFGAWFYIGHLASRGTIFGFWGVLFTLDALFSLAAIVGTGFALLRRKLLLALLFSLLAWPVGAVIEGTRCDTEPGCRMLGWATLRIGDNEWSIRIRPVTERNEAENLAATALYEADSAYSTYNPQRFGDHWLVATIDEDGWPGPNAVRVDTRTGATSFVPCPADRMLCGMERAVVSDGERVFSNGRWDLAMTFPAGRSVCTARPVDDDLSYDGRGFYGMIRDADIPCDIVDPSRTIGLEALKARTMREALLEPCKPLSPAILRVFDGRTPGFSNRQSVVCEEIGNDQIAVGVYTVAGPSPGSGNASTTLYQAWMLTDEAHLAEDARTFEAFLRTARIGVPASS